MGSVLLYHGSHRLFEHFKISKELTITPEQTLPEGYGVYMSDSEEFAKSYGDYCYLVAVDEKDIFDTTYGLQVRAKLTQLMSKTGVYFNRYFSIDELVDGVMLGELSVTNLSKEINDLLDSNEDFYNNWQDRITYEEDCVLRTIQREWEELLPPVIKYYDKGFKRKIWICKKNPEVLQILRIECPTIK
jgi:hypothetical protein